jgi:hypothetical protein
MFQVLAIKILCLILNIIPATFLSDQVVAQVTAALQTGSFLWFGEERLPKTLK